jgi:hypothetical protein
MGISQGQSEILDKITEEVTNQEELYNTIKTETLPGLQESISEAQKLLSTAYESVNGQTNAVNNLIKATEDLLTASEGLRQLYLIAGDWEMVDSSPDVIGSVTPHASGGLIREPTLLTDIATGKPYGTMAETQEEWIVPTDKMGTSIVINNTFPNLSVRNDSDLLDIKRQLRQMESVVKDELRSGGQNG